MDGTDGITGDWNRIVRNNANEYSLGVSSIAEVKEWVDGTTVGEWCLLTVDEYPQVFPDTAPANGKIYWKLGSVFR